MHDRRWITIAAGSVLLAPSVAMANGMVHMIESFEFTFAGGAIGCVAGVVFALARHAKIGGLLALAIGGGLAAGLIAAATYVGANNAFFFPNNVGLIGALAIIAGGTGVAGGLALGLVAAGIRALMRQRAAQGALPGPDTGAGN